MNIEEFRDFCIDKPAVTESFPFDATTLVFKVAGKMFALTDLNPPFKINLKCEPEKAQELRAEYDDIQPGYHMSKIHWNTININKNVSDKMVYELIDHSYELVFKSLTKKIQTEIIELHN